MEDCVFVCLAYIDWQIRSARRPNALIIFFGLTALSVDISENLETLVLSASSAITSVSSELFFVAF